MEIVWNALQKRISVCACFCWWLFCAWCTNCNIRTDRARWALANAGGILFQLPESTATWWGENGREVCDLLLPTWYDVMMDTRITWEKNDNFYRERGFDSTKTCRILPDGDNLCETMWDHWSPPLPFFFTWRFGDKFVCLVLGMVDALACRGMLSYKTDSNP